MNFKKISATLVGLIMAVSFNAKAGLIDNATIKRVVASTTHQKLQQFDPYRAIDGDFATTWATQGEGAGAWIEFNFEAPVLISEIWFSDRNSPGDNVVRFQLDFTNDSTTKTQEVFSPEFNNTEIISINDGKGFYAEYLRFTVLEAGVYTPTNGGYETHPWRTNVGAKEFSFYSPSTVSPVPEPSTLAMFTLGILGLALRRYKKQ